MNKIIGLIRHGQTINNQQSLIQGRENNPLNDEGRLQAKKLGNYLKINDPIWNVIYSSPLDRALETAKIIAEQLNFQNNIIINKDFIEREFGDASGKPVSDDIFQKLYHNQIKGAESSSDIQKRVLSALNEIIKTCPEQKILIVAHSHTIKALLTLLDCNWTFNKPLYNCSISYLSYQNEKMTIISSNILPKN